MNGSVLLEKGKTMKLIDADALIEKLSIAKDCNDCEHDEAPYCRWKPDVIDICEAINDAPTIDAMPVKHAKLVDPNPYGECSICDFLIDIRQNYNYCPNCGARMDGEHDG